LHASAIKQLTGLDIPAATQTGIVELEAVINDAIASLRARVWKTEFGERVSIHNADYGFARNFTGLYPVWLTFALLSFAGTSALFFLRGGSPVWFGVATILVPLSIALAFVVLPPYVRQRARYYAESFFAAVTALHESEGSRSAVKTRRPSGRRPSGAVSS